MYAYFMNYNRKRLGVNGLTLKNNNNKKTSKPFNIETGSGFTLYIK